MEEETEGYAYIPVAGRVCEVVDIAADRREWEVVDKVKLGDEFRVAEPAAVDGTSGGCFHLYASEGHEEVGRETYLGTGEWTPYRHQADGGEGIGMERLVEHPGSGGGGSESRGVDKRGVI